MVLFDQPNHFSFIQSGKWCEPNPNSISKSIDKPISSSLNTVFDLTFNGTFGWIVLLNLSTVSQMNIRTVYGLLLGIHNIHRRCYCLNQFLTASVMFRGTKMLVYWILFCLKIERVVRNTRI